MEERKKPETAVDSRKVDTASLLQPNDFTPVTTVYLEHSMFALQS